MIRDVFSLRRRFPRDTKIIGRIGGRLALVRGTVDGQCIYGVFSADKFGFPATDDGIHFSFDELVSLNDLLTRLIADGKVCKSTDPATFNADCEALQFKFNTPTKPI